MILVDTSVWIEFFKKREPLFSRLREEIEAGRILAHSLVFAELLQGCRNNSEAELVLNYWETLRDSESTSGIVAGGLLSFQLKLIAKGIGLVDAVLVSETRRRKTQLWTLDKGISRILEDFELFN